MKADLLFKDTGQILILTSYESLSNKHFIEKLETKGKMYLFIYISVLSKSMKYT
jgi:hypothetical protein